MRSGAGGERASRADHPTAEMLIWNPWHGCRKISEGCTNCYMYYLDLEHGRDGSDIRRVKSGFDLPLRRSRAGEYKLASGSRVNVCLTSDFFLEEADDWRGEAWEIMRLRPDLTFSLLTKRAHRIKECLPPDWGDGWSNVSLAVTAENQRRADERIPLLLAIPAHERGVMCAPLLGEIDLLRYLDGLDYVLADGENYAGARPCRFEWVKKLSVDCAAKNKSFTFCGTGEYFVKDGRTYRIPRELHAAQAERSGLSYTPV